MEEMLYAALYPDDFDIQFRRQGWLSFDYARPEVLDPQRLTQRWVHSMTRAYGPHAFYDLFGQNTFRKVLGYLYTHAPCSRADLEGLCSGAVLDEHLAFMQDQELAEEVGGLWRKAARFQHVDNIGRTLEWYVAEWFKTVLAAPARYGVHVDDLAEGGDLDVVAFVGGLRLSIECKSGRDITRRQLELFVERASDFAPDAAVLLIDTESSIERHIQTLNGLRDLGNNPFAQQDQHGTLYWGMRNGYVVNTKRSIGHSLAAVLRLYHTRVKHVPFVG